MRYYAIFSVINLDFIFTTIVFLPPNQSKNPNPLFQFPPWDETAEPGENPRFSTKRWKTLSTYRWSNTSIKIAAICNKNWPRRMLIKKLHG